MIGHVGLIPSKSTWTGGFKAVGKTASSAMEVFELVKRYEAVGALGVEIEVVPEGDSWHIIGVEDTTGAYTGHNTPAMSMN